MPRRPGTSSPRSQIFQFLAKFLATWFLTLGAIAAIPAVDRWTVQATMASLAAVAHLLRMEYVAAGSYVTLAGATLDIVSDCTPLMPTLALWCAILAFPARWTWKALGMSAGALLLWIYNLSRVLALALVLRHHPAWFEFVHAYLWQTATLGIVLLMFIGWVRIQMQRRVTP
jgi:exosortase/archaeosortase family protein